MEQMLRTSSMHCLSKSKQLRPPQCQTNTQDAWCQLGANPHTQTACTHAHTLTVSAHAGETVCRFRQQDTNHRSSHHVGAMWRRPVWADHRPSDHMHGLHALRLSSHQRQISRKQSLQLQLFPTLKQAAPQHTVNDTTPSASHRAQNALNALPSTRLTAKCTPMEQQPNNNQAY